jgi:hypothetical protein
LGCRSVSERVNLALHLMPEEGLEPPTRGL